jgi:hypothetical protein
VRIATGDYRVFFFDSYGGKVKEAKKVKAQGLISAIKKGRRYCKVCGYNSFRIDRVIFNSLDGHSL